MFNFVIFLPVISIRIINLKTTMRAKHMSGRQEKRYIYIYIILVEISEGKNRLEHQGLDG